MASRIMHLTVTSLLLAECTVKNPGAVLAGSMLPDAMLPEQNSRASHFVAERDGRRTYDASEFRRLFGQYLGEEGLYLGYDLHLIQDIAYRRMLYGKYRLRCRTPEEMQRLYRDYAILNGYLIQKHHLSCPCSFPDGIEGEEVCKRYSLHPQALLEDLKKDFAGTAQGETAFFSREMAEEFIQSALALCKKELAALQNGLPLLDPWELAWAVIL